MVGQWTVKAGFVAGLAVVVLGCGRGAQERSGGERSGGEVTASASGAVDLQRQGLKAVKFDERRMPDALELAQANEEFSTLVRLIEEAGLENAVKNQGPLTVFAPPNEAFEKVDAATLEAVRKDRQKLAYVLTHHVAPEKYTVEKLEELAREGRKLYMASGEYVPVEKRADGLYVGGAKILSSHRVANGWVHVVDRLIFPENLK